MWCTFVLAGSFHLYDSDHDGYITRKEVEDIVDSMHKMVGQMVELSEDDESPQARVDKIFETMDLVSYCYHQEYIRRRECPTALCLSTNTLF